MSDLKQIGVDVDVNGVIENARQSFSETENDILRRLLLPRRSDRGASYMVGDLDLPVSSEPTRARGRWTVEVKGKKVSAANLKEAYRMGLLLLSEEFPDFLQAFSEERARARRFVARTPTQLYLNTPELAKHHAKPLRDGWFFDTNLSTDQVARRIRIAARICGLRYGSDVQILNGFEQI